MLTTQQFQTLLPLACAWVEQQEQIILCDGVPLTPGQLADARKIGIIHPEKVRLLMVDEIPTPQHPLLVAAIKRVWADTTLTKGLTLQYGIFIRAGFWDDRRLVFHELVHTAQYERLGGINNFLREYLFECLTVGYPDGQLEQEAILKTAAMCV